MSELVSVEQVEEKVKIAKKTQKIDNGIDAQKRVFEVPVQIWSELRDLGEHKKIFSPKELGVIGVAEQIPSKIPSEK